MNINLEKAMILLIVAVFIVTSINSLNALGNPITREEAIEISKNSGLVKEGMATTQMASIDPTHYNSSMVEQLRGGHNWELYERVPVGDSVWKVVWWFSYWIGGSSGYTVIVIVDAETGIMIHETKGIILV